jgi:hypothetical protein
MNRKSENFTWKKKKTSWEVDKVDNQKLYCIFSIAAQGRASEAAELLKTSINTLTASLGGEYEPLSEANFHATLADLPCELSQERLEAVEPRLLQVCSPGSVLQSVQYSWQSSNRTLWNRTSPQSEGLLPRRMLFVWIRGDVRFVDCQL